MEGYLDASVIAESLGDPGTLGVGDEYSVRPEVVGFLGKVIKQGQ